MAIDRTANLLGAAAQLVVDGQMVAIEDTTGLNPTEMAALITIINEPDQPIDFLHKAIKRSHSATVRLVAKLVDRQLITKIQSAQDGRGMALAATKSGEKLVASALRSRRSTLNGLLTFLSTDEQAMLDGLLAKLLAASVVDELNAYQICRYCDADACDVCPVEESFA